MVAVRVRHPRGVTTLDLDPANTTVDELKVLLFSSTEIPPSEQEIKYGYPPKPLPEVDGPISTIPIGRGEQIIVTSLPPTASTSRHSHSHTHSHSHSHTSHNAHSATPAPSVKPLNESLSAPTPALPPPARTASAPAPATEEPESVEVPGDGGTLLLRKVPDDNSCLFSAIGVVFEGGIDAAQKLRKKLRAVVADTIRGDPTEYPDVVLGMPRETYITKILQRDTWGGAIELSVFAKHYKTEISSFDVATGRCDRFGGDQYDTRCLLVYSGIHYDALTLAPFPDAPSEFHTTLFPLQDYKILPAAEKLVARLKQKHYYTDTASFDLRCGVCGEGLKGEKGAREHAMQTGHVEFGEY